MKKKEILVEDWHKADIKAALEKKGVKLEDIARTLKLAEGGVSNVWRGKSDPIQSEIARVLGVKPEVIWPSRY